jgi:hypothetical protein
MAERKDGYYWVQFPPPSGKGAPPKPKFEEAK